MRIFSMIAIMLLCSCEITAAQEDAFVRQLSTQSLPRVQQGPSSSGAFVGQLPTTAKPRSIARVPARTQPHYVPKVFIGQTTQASTGNSLVIDEAPGIIGYGEAPRPALPTVHAGVSVVLTSPATTNRLPNIGTGAVVL